MPSDLYEYAANASTVLRRTHTDYNLTSTYISSTRRIIGLPTFQYLYDGSPGSLMSKVETTYDDASLMQSTPSAPVQHDEANYGSGFVLGRRNASRTRRYDVVTASLVESQVGVNSAGSVVFTRDPLGHQVTLSFFDSFAQTGTSIPGAAYAYPTTVTDGDGFSSTSQYNYDHGAVTRAQDPKGAFSSVTYDAAGRVSRNDVSNGAYTRFVYPNASSTAQGMISFTLIQTGGAEFYSEQVLDGAGRVITATSDFPGSTGRYRGQFTAYDIMGRQFKVSNPLEITNQWIPAGDDAETGWVYTNQAYDWKGRPTVTVTGGLLLERHP
ncbi:MAG: hypothetical protein AABO41_10010 [Acidobacteriota bacterium]